MARSLEMVPKRLRATAIPQLPAAQCGHHDSMKVSTSGLPATTSGEPVSLVIGYRTCGSTPPSPTVFRVFRGTWVTFWTTVAESAVEPSEVGVAACAAL